MCLSPCLTTGQMKRIDHRNRSVNRPGVKRSPLLTDPCLNKACFNTSCFNTFCAFFRTCFLGFPFCCCLSPNLACGLVSTRVDTCCLTLTLAVHDQTFCNMERMGRLTHKPWVRVVYIIYNITEQSMTIHFMIMYIMDTLTGFPFFDGVCFCSDDEYLFLHLVLFHVHIIS